MLKEGGGGEKYIITPFYTFSCFILFTKFVNKKLRNNTNLTSHFFGVCVRVCTTFIEKSLFRVLSRENATLSLFKHMYLLLIVLTFFLILQ